MSFEDTKVHANGGLVPSAGGQDLNKAKTASLPMHPELQDVKLVEDGLLKAKTYTGGRATVDLYHGTAKEGMSRSASLSSNQATDNVTELLRNVQADTLQEILGPYTMSVTNETSEREIRIW